MQGKGFEKRDWLLVLAAAALCAGYFSLGHFASESAAPWREEKLAASRLARDAMAAVRREKIDRGIPLDRTADVNQTGMIGVRWPGLIRSSAEAGARVGGLMKTFLDRRIPVIHLLDLKRLAAQHGLPYDPMPQPEPGSSGVFRMTKYHRGYLAALLALAVLFVIAYVVAGKRARC